MLDTRASEDHGSDPTIMEHCFDTEFPTSCNDEDLDPGQNDPPARRHGVSEMTFCLIRYEICLLSKQLSYSPQISSLCKETPNRLTLEDKENLVRDAAAMWEEKYLQYCENAGPLYWVAATVARLITAKFSLILYSPLTSPGKPNTLPQDTRDRLFMAAIEIIEYSRVLEDESSNKQWGWLFQTYIQWHAIAYLLGELCTRPNSTIAERAWRAIDSVFGGWTEAVTHSKSGMLWKPLKKLMTKARANRARQNQNQNPDALGAGIDESFILDEPSSYPKITPAHNRLLPDVTNTIPPQPQNDYPSSFLEDPASMEQQGMFQPQQQAWLMDDSALADLDMADLEGDVSWEGWDDLVREFSMEAQPLEQRGPALGSMGTWW